MVYSKIGVVICEEVGSNIAGIVFSDAESPLYVLPKSLFIIDSAELKNMSKTQISKREKLPCVGINLEFNANNDGVITGFAFSSTIYRDVVYGKDGILQLKTSCVISNEKPACRCWTKLFGFICVDEKFTDFIIPNVLYSCRINFHLDLGIAEDISSNTEVDLRKFQPRFYIDFSSFDGVIINESLPWNRNLQLTINLREFDNPPLEYPTESTTHEAVDHCRNVRCLCLDFNQAFCPDKPNEKCVIAFIYTQNVSFGPGCQLLCNMYFCKFNQCWIIYNYMRLNLNQFPVDYETDGGLIILVRAKKDDNRPGHFYNDFTSVIGDPFKLMSAKQSTVEQSSAVDPNNNRMFMVNSTRAEKFCEVWVQRITQPHNYEIDNNAQFIIIDVPVIN